MILWLDADIDLKVHSSVLLTSLRTARMGLIRLIFTTSVHLRP
jgi:hypothetical protein